MGYNNYSTDKKVIVSNGGIGLGTIGLITFIVFLIIKLTANPVWLTWFWVWFPLWIPLAVYFGLIFIIAIVTLIIVAFMALLGR